MSNHVQSRKRKAVVKDPSPPEEAAVFDELGNGPLNGIFSDTDEDPPSLDSEAGSDDVEDDEEELASDEIPSEDDGPGDGPKSVGKGHLPDIPSNNNRQAANEVREFSDDEDVSDEDDLLKDPVPTLSQDANGNIRYVYREIDPVYDSDDSDAPANENTIGNIPLSFYDSYPHIGYDLDGKKVMRPAKGAALDSLLDSIDIPKGWTGLTDPATGKPLELSGEEMDVLKRLTRNEIPEDGYDPYPDMVEYFTNTTEPMPLSAAPEPKRRFVPSKHEAVRVMKIVKAIKEGRIQPYKPPPDRDEEEEERINFDLWADEAPRSYHPTNLPAPKLPPPGYDESYHPPPEYLPDESERKTWLEMDEEDRDKEYLPVNHDALRKVPGYEKFVKEKFERCLDLYLAPRVRRSKLNIDPESMLPKLPSPEELKPFPTRCDILYRGHQGRVRSIAFDPLGNFLASGGDDGTVRIWGVNTGRLLWHVKLTDQNNVDTVSWRPNKDAFILAAAAGDSIYLMAPNILAYPTGDEDVAQISKDLLNAGWTAREPGSTSESQTKAPPAKWTRPEMRLQERGVVVQITVRSAIKVVCWHRHGDYFSTLSPGGQRSAVVIHTLSKHLSQLPFRKLKGLPQSVQFHPSKPILFVATQRMIRSYDLVRQQLVKILRPGVRWISSFDVHPGGDNLVVGSFDKRLLWIDTDLSVRPYKIMRYHTKGVRSVKFHQGGYPLFADASDDGNLLVYHGKVVGDLMENATIVPLQLLRGHRVEGSLGALDVAWHPTEPWLASAGADGTCRLWRP